VPLKIHPTEELLEALKASLDEQGQRVLEHVVWCRRCRLSLLYLPRPDAPEPERAAFDYGPALAAAGLAAEAWEAAIRRERDAAPGLFLELTEPPAERWAPLAGSSSRFHTWGVLELLIERGLEVSARDPERGEALSLLALQLADRLDAERYGAERIEDLRARAWAHAGNACRLKADFRAAEEAFRNSSLHLRKGTGDPLERAVVLDLKASLRRAQRRFPDAFRLLRRAVAIFLDYGERHLAGRSLVKLATVHHHAGEPAEAIPLLRRALGMIDPEQEPRLLLCARHNLVLYLAETGRFLEAQAMYREARPLYRNFPDEWTQNRRNWVKGRIERGLGQLQRAESLFLAARDGFVAEGVPYDTALVSLDLALLYAGQGRTAELKKLAEEMLPIFTSRQIHREALAALAFLRQAIEAERAEAEIVAAVADFLQQARHSPELRFQA
jgi:tetratricopeptide (TPR) repeat protein